MEAGAPRPMIEVWTHTKKTNMMSNYTRVSWVALCVEMQKLTFVLDGDPLGLCHGHVTRDAGLRTRWVIRAVADDKKRPRRDEVQSGEGGSPSDDEVRRFL